MIVMNEKIILIEQNFIIYTTIWKHILPDGINILAPSSTVTYFVIQYNLFTLYCMENIVCCCFTPICYTLSRENIYPRLLCTGEDLCTHVHLQEHSTSMTPQ